MKQAAIVLFMSLLLVSCIVEEALPTTAPVAQVPTNTAIPQPSLTDTLAATSTPTVIPTPPLPTFTPEPTQSPASTVVLDPSLPLSTGRIYFLWDPNPIPEERGIGELSEISLFEAVIGNMPDSWHIAPITEIASQPAMSIVPAPDANKIAVIHYDDTNGDGTVDPQRGVDVSNVYIYKMADGSVSQLTDNEWSTTVSWLPDSQALAYSQHSEVLLVAADAPLSFEPLVTLSGYISRLAWSPDGNQLASLHAPSSSSGHPMGSTILDLFRPVTGDLAIVVRDTEPNVEIEWSATSQWLAFQQTRYRGLSVVNTATLELIELVPSDERSLFEWSPNGEQLAFTYQNTLFLWDGDNLDPKELISANALFMPTWSPDGSRIAVGFAENDRTGMFIIDLANGRQQAFNLGRVAQLIYWSPDGQWLLFLSAQDDSAGLYLVNSEGGEPYLFLETTGRQLPYDIYWLPDDTSTP